MSINEAVEVLAMLAGNDRKISVEEAVKIVKMINSMPIDACTTTKSK